MKSQTNTYNPRSPRNLLIAFAATLAATQSVAAPSLPGQEYFVVNSTIGGFVQTLMTTGGARIELTDGVRGQITRTRLSGETAEVLEQLSNEYELDWFLFNGVYYVSGRHESTVRIVRLGELSFPRIEKELRETGLLTDALNVLEAANGETAVMSGPPKLLAIAEVIIESISVAAPTPSVGIRVRRANSLSVEPGIDTTNVAEDAK